MTGPGPNRFYSAVAVQVALNGGINNSTLSMTVSGTTGFPGSFPYTLSINQNEATEELVTVTAAAGLVLTIVRGVDGTTGVAHSNGASVVHAMSARDLLEPQAHLGAYDGVHGVAGLVVGTTDAQVLTNKTLTSPTVNSGTFTGTIGGTPTYSGPPTFQGGLFVTGASVIDLQSAALVKPIVGPQMQTYSPTVNWTVGNGTLAGGYVQYGKLTYFQVTFVPGTTSSASGGQSTFTLPLAPFSYAHCSGVVEVAGSFFGFRGFNASAGSTTVNLYNSGTNPMSTTAVTMTTGQPWIFEGYYQATT